MNPGAWIDPAFLRALAAFALNGSILALFGRAAARRLAPSPWIAATWVPLAAGAVTALCGYGVFWATFAAPLLGRAASLLLLLAAIIGNFRSPSPVAPGVREWRATVGLQVAIGLFYLGLLYLFAVRMSFYDLTGNRWLAGMTSDNRLPYDFAARLYHGASLKPFDGDWLSSDRPPLQAGWELIAWPVTAACGLDAEVASGTAALWFQLLWVPAAYGLFRSLGPSQARARAWTCALALSGFFLMHTTYTWPKLAAGGLVCGAFGLWVLPGPGRTSARAGAAGGALAALACLAHGGAMFSLLPLVPWAAWRCARGEGAKWAAAAAVYLALMLPWSAYQRFYDPPGNRLVKWHLAGQIPIDGRGTLQTLRESYRALSWDQIVAIRKENFRIQFLGDFSDLFHYSAHTTRDRSAAEFFYTARALTWWPAGLVLLPVALLRRSGRRHLRDHRSATLRLGAWTVATLVAWCLLMFLPGQAIVHQGSFGAMIAGFVFLSAGMEAAGAWTLYLLIALQSVTLATTWLGPTSVVHGRIDLLAGTIALAAIAWFLHLSALRDPPCPTPVPS
jgi:hypothetical protein